MGGKIEIIKKLYLIIRTIKLRAFSGFTFPLRRKAFPRESTHNILVIALKRAGDTILSIPTFRAIKENLPHSQLTVFANTYVREILERIDYIDNIEEDEYISALIGIVEDSGGSNLKYVVTSDQYELHISSTEQPKITFRPHDENM